MDELLGEFLAETDENLERLDTELLRFEREPNNQEILNKIFRLVHTIKGTCGFFGLDRLSAIAHATESRLGEYREGEAVTVEGVSVVLACLDRIKEILRGLEEGKEPPGDDADLIDRLEALKDMAALDVGPEEHAETSTAATSQPAQNWEKGPRRSVAPEGLPEPPKPRAFFNAAPEPETAETADAPEETPSEEPEAAKETDVLAEADASEESQPKSEKPAGDANPDMIQMVRVRVDTLEHLMTTVSELVLTRNQLMDVARRTDETGFKAPLHRLSNVTNELQRGIMKARMLPISKSWQKLPRLVRELSLSLDKPIKLISEGGDVELDRQVLEFVRDPLTHLIRNAADHGIESRAERQAAGKPEQGMIRLRAFSEGGHIVIEIADDGRGLNARAIRDKCLEKGLATAAELDQLTDSELQQFVFRPGFSTAAEVTDVSGRGVGLDVVRSDIELIGGTVELKSSSARGSVFVMRIPLTLAITAALIVESEDLRFALPQHNVVEVVRAHAGSDYRIEMVNDAPQLRLRGKLVPVFDLAELLGERGAEARAPERFESGMTTVAVVELGSRIFGIIVDDVLRTEEIVVKPKASLLRNLTVFSGNTILGDGSVIMIIDPTALAHLAGVDEIRVDSLAAPVEVEAKPEEEEKLPLLLFMAGSSSRKAVPLSLVTRLEEIPASQLELCDEGYVLRYRDGLMPVLFMEGVKKRSGEDLQPILVFSEEGRNVGLAIDEIVDIVEEKISMEIHSNAPGVLGACLVHGEVVEVVDVSRYVGEGLGHRILVKETEGSRTQRVLLVDDSQFFRNMLAPLLSANGYDVTLAASAHEALELKEEGQLFNVIISDLEMPDLDGIAFAEKVKADRAWAETPMIALSSHTSARLIARTRAAGFADYVGKFDRQKLMDALETCCSRWEAAA
ncbi:hybrid sensor histidine kinase/response regulator [Methyloligella solikamskensis]|uniref:histidine kinase n=1 Tax=Methyloligella solikamskensis TaxID=1177756 RepID=A0ABW3J8J6_9HYPH